MSNDFDAPELPEIDASLTGGGFEGDFAKMMQQVNTQGPSRDIPPLHPQKKHIITDEEMDAVWKKEQSQQLFVPSNKTFRCECGVYNLGDEDQRTEYQNMINNCLQKGWLLARDDWSRTQDGAVIAAVKCLIPEPKKKKKGKDGNGQT